MPRTLLLDLDGTLVDTVPDLAACLNRLMAARHLPAFSHPEVAAMVGDGVAALVTRAFAAHQRQSDPADLDQFAADYAAHAAIDSKPFPGVLPVLSGLAADGWQLAVCTNKPERPARALLEACGLLRLLCTVGGGDSFAARKPDPAHLLATLARSGASPDTALMLGDHRNDVIAARGAGLRSIFALWGYAAPGMETGATAVARDIAEAAAIARRLLP